MLRPIITIIFGAILSYCSYQFKYSTNIFLLAGFVITSIIGLCSWLGFILFELSKKQVRLSTLLAGIASIIVVLIINWQVSSIFEKPTLVKVFYNGDFNFKSIDFKEDGSYIYESSAIGMSDFIHGKYRISADTIIIDRNKIENDIVSDHLIIIKKKTAHANSLKVDTFLAQSDIYGKLIGEETDFRIIVDNRDKSNKIQTQ